MQDWSTIHDEIETFLKKPTKRKLILIPRGHLKSSVVSIGWSIQQALRNPNIRILLANNVWDFSRNFLLRPIQQYLQAGNPLSQFWGRLESDNWNQDECTIRLRNKVLSGPTWSTTGLEKERTGSHYDLIIADDLVAEQNVQTPEQLKKVVDYYGNLYPLLEPNGTIVVVGTRWHQRDLYSLLMEDPKYDKFIRTAYRDEERTQVLFPEKFTVEILNDLKNDPTYGRSKFAAQYMNNPVDEEFADFKKEQIRYYEPATPHPASLYLTVDPAISLGSDADFSAFVVAGQFADRKIRVVDRLRKRVIPSELVDTLFELVGKWRLHRVGLETFAFQKTLKYEIQRQQRERGTFFSIDELGKRHSGRGEPILSKEARIRRLQPYFEQGLVEIRSDMSDLVDELLAFPRGRHDDLIDALSYQLDYLVPSQNRILAKPEVYGSMGWWIKNHTRQGTQTIYDKFFSDLNPPA